MHSNDASDALALVVRQERTRLIATLVRRYGFDLAEESVDAAIEHAMVQWGTEGVPASPAAWLLSVARRRAIDRLRHRSTVVAARASLEVIAEEYEQHQDPEVDASSVPDDRLRLVFTCCHPAIAKEAQVALALRWISGLSTEDVARAFCVSVDAMAQRLTRAKNKIETARIPYEIPEARELEGRVSSVLEVIYAIFNEGYVATKGDTLQRVSLAEEALRLAELVELLLPSSGETKALHALLLLIHARRDARVTPTGELIRLEEQDRSLWDRGAMDRGKALLTQALELAPPSPYAVEAAIQAIHDEAKTYAATDFLQIVTLYGVLRRMTDAPIVRVNEAVARSMVEGPDQALSLLEELDREGVVAGHPALPAAKADLYRRVGKREEALAAYADAIRATSNEAERRFLERQRRTLETESTERAR